jgi:hypothetical protein
MSSSMSIHEMKGEDEIVEGGTVLAAIGARHQGRLRKMEAKQERTIF